MISLYIDTNIFLNIANEETNPYGRDMALPASRLFHQVISCKYYILVSSWTQQELYRKTESEELAMILALCRKKTIMIEHDESDIAKAKTKSPENWQDALHVILAEKASADYIVTRNIDDFIKIATTIPIKKPEELT